MNVENKIQQLGQRIGTDRGAAARNGSSAREHGTAARNGSTVCEDGTATLNGSSAREDRGAARSGTLGGEEGAAHSGLRALPPPHPFAAYARLESDRAIVTCRGELDIASIATLAECLVGIAFVVHDLVLDFAELEFIDACGLRTIASTAQQVRAYGGSVSIRSPSPMVERLLDLVNFKQIVAVEPHALT